MTKNRSKPRRLARDPKAPAVGTIPKPPKAPSKLDQIELLLLAPNGASIAEIMHATGWQKHSVRGAMAGALKKRGWMIASGKVDGLRRCHASKPA